MSDFAVSRSSSTIEGMDAPVVKGQRPAQRVRCIALFSHGLQAAQART